MYEGVKKHIADQFGYSDVFDGLVSEGMVEKKEIVNDFFKEASKEDIEYFLKERYGIYPEDIEDYS